MAKVFPIGQPANDSERRAIAFLRDRLPDDWLIFHNFEMRQGQEVFEIDLAVLAPHAVYLVDVKGTRGNIDVYGSKWYPEGRQPFVSPLAKLRQHARILATIIRESNSSQTELRKAHVHATVLLTADDASLSDPDGRDSPDVTDLKHCLQYFRDTSRIPANRLGDIRRFHGQIAKVITGKGKPKKAALTFRDWQVEERLGGTDRYTEYRAKHGLLGKGGGMVRLRVYQADPYQDEADRQAELKRISNAYRAVAHMPAHPNILAVKDFFQTDEEDQVVLVTDDMPGQALWLHFKKPSLALTFDQKLQVMRDVLAALDHAHHYEVIHRNLTPDAILVAKAGQAVLTSFDYARVGKNRTSTIADQIVDELDEESIRIYQAPECNRDPSQASIASDIYSAGIVFFELLTGEAPFDTVDQMMEADGRFPVKPSELRPDLPPGIDEWLQTFCEFDPEDRHVSAAVARKALDGLMLPEGQDDSSPVISGTAVGQPIPDDLTNLPQDFDLAGRFRIQKKLGSGGFGVAYQVFDSMADVVRVIKLVTRDRISVFERLRREYKTLVNLPEHPNVVKVIWADRLTDTNQTPYIVFEYIDGWDVSIMIDAEALSLTDAFHIAQQTAAGLAHLHTNGVYHQDVKPSNLLWTDNGVRLIDFNVAVSDQDDGREGGGTRRYLPPDYDYTVEPAASDRIDRDLYALGITVYECVTGHYPFDEPTPPIRKAPKDPRQFKGCADLSTGLIDVLLKTIAPERKNRFASAEEVLAALGEVAGHLRSGFTTGDAPELPVVPPSGFDAVQPNSNPFVTHLLTLYSQSRLSNAGTRGLDAIGRATYVSTYLDDKLKPALLAHEFRLVVISGNAGDGKTAFIQQFEASAQEQGAQLKRGANGAIFQLDGHTFQSNYDGSQDEGDERNDAVLERFFAPFAGESAESWPINQTRLIAINEGRLVDFFSEHEDQFPLLSRQIQAGLAGGEASDGVTVVNLNLRSVVAEPAPGEPSIMERLVDRLTAPEHWAACESCDLKDKCYALHNARTFQDPVAGRRVVERLRMLYTITHLRGRIHITMRDLRSAVAFMLVGTRDCAAIHTLYQNGGEDAQNAILGSLYFNSWMGGTEGSADRLIGLLREIDIAQVSNPDLDRELGFLSPASKQMSRFSFADRGSYDDDLMQALFAALPRDITASQRTTLISKHRNYVSHMRRRHFFERRDPDHSGAGWRDMLPYRSIERFLAAILKADQDGSETASILRAINRGEGLAIPDQLGNRLALRVRTVDKGTIRSYRLFDGDKFSLSSAHKLDAQPFLETLPPALVLTYQSDKGHAARLRITLDIYEMLQRLNSGYQPSVEEQEGFYLSLGVFKNALSSAPYQELLLSESGYDFFQISRDSAGVLHLEKRKEDA